MNNDRPYFLRRIITTPGAHAYSQQQLMEDMQAKVMRLEFSSAKTSSGNLKRNALLALATAFMPENSKSLSQMVTFLYDHSEIQQRHFEFELEEINKRKDWYKTINDATFSLSVRTLEELFETGIAPAHCDGLIVVSSTHAGFPGLTRKLQGRFGFPLETLCFDLTAMGCAGGPHGIQLAQTLLETGRCKNVCVLCVDAMGTYGLSSKPEKLPSVSQIVANCLTSDGAAALVLSREEDPEPVLSYRNCALTTKFWTDSLGINVLSVSEDNQPYLWVGKEIQTRLLDELGSMVDDSMLEAPVFLHPGGIALMKLVRERYPKLTDSTELSISELGETGNIGAPSVLFVLKKALSKDHPLSPCFRLIAFGPGKVTAILLVDGVDKGTRS